MTAWDIVRVYMGYIPEDMQEGLEMAIETYARLQVSKAMDHAYVLARGTDRLNDPKFTRSQMYWKGRADAANAVRGQEWHK